LLRENPRTYRRAATAIAQCRNHLDKAEQEMALAMDILEDLNDEGSHLPSDPSERQGWLETLGLVLTKLRETRQTLAQAWKPTRQPIPILTGRKELQ
jgi:uncharacterized membrane protein YccC